MSNKIILYAIVFILLALLISMTLFPGIIHAWKDSGKSGLDKCKPAPGYTEESW